MKKFKLSELVLDFDLYPRGGVDSHHVGEIAAAMEAGAKMPPLVICKDSKRIVDGFHRWKVARRVHGEDYKAQCVEREYPSDKELFLDAMRYNASHGRALTQHDKVYCLILAEKFGIKSELVAESLNITMGRVSSLKGDRIGRVQSGPIALKRTVKHMAGRDLTPEQESTNKKLSGMNQSFYANQLIALIESDMLDTSNTELMEALFRLHRLIGSLAAKAA